MPLLQYVLRGRKCRRPERVISAGACRRGSRRRPASTPQQLSQDEPDNPASMRVQRSSAASWRRRARGAPAALEGAGDLVAPQVTCIDVIHRSALSRRISHQRRRNARLGWRPGACRGHAPQCVRGRPDRSCGAPRQGRCRLLGQDLGRTARSNRRLATGARFLRSIWRQILRQGRPARTRAAAATRGPLGDGCLLACHRRRGAHGSCDPAGPALVVPAARGLGALGRRVTHGRGSGRPSGCVCAALSGLGRSPPRRRCIMPLSSPRPSLSRSWLPCQWRPGGPRAGADFVRSAGP